MTIFANSFIKKAIKMSLFNSVLNQIKEIANLSEHVDTTAAERAIRSNIVFKGPNIWILAFSIIIASVGLNVNSTPVIIGAMLISPLMGPIIGLGLGLGINDLNLLKDAAKNLLVMVSISLLASILYFLITPLSLSNPTELLARTNPTIYDVLIALFGGFAGIFELCRKEKGTVFSGVAIATALMPPLCTAGFGLASGNLTYFFGALYLFFINCIFIMLATYLTVKYMHFKEADFASEKTHKRTRIVITVVVLVMIIPSIISAVVMVKENNFDKDVEAFVSDNKSFENAYIYDYKISHHKGSKVQLFISGETMSAAQKEKMFEDALKYGIEREQIVITEHFLSEGASESEIVKGIYERSDSEISKRDAEIQRLEKKISELQGEEIPFVQIAREVANQYPSIKEIFMSRGAKVETTQLTRTDAVFIVIRTEKELTAEEKERLTNWMKIRLNFDNVVLNEEIL